MNPARNPDGIRLTGIVQEMMTVGAILLRATFARLPWCHWRFLAIRCAPIGWLPRYRFKEILRVGSPTRIPELRGRVKFDS